MLWHWYQAPDRTLLGSGADSKQISVFFILPETKSVSLERMDKLFGEIDFVVAGEQETDMQITEAIAYEKADRGKSEAFIEYVDGA